MTRRLAYGLCLLLVVGAWAGGSWALWPVLFGALAWPVLRRLAPDEPAPLKVLYFALLLSPPLALGLWMVAAVALPGGLAGHGVLLLGLPFGLGLFWERAPRAARREPIGRGQLIAVALSLGFAVWVAWTLQRGALARVSFHGLLHASIVESVGASMPPENPWLAGQELGYYWVWHALGAMVVDWLGLAPTRALAWLNVWAALVLPLGLYFWVAGFRGRGRGLGARDLVGVGLGLVGLNLLGGAAWLLRGAELTTPDDLLGVLANLRELVLGGADPRTAWGPSKFGNASSYPVALALLVGGVLAGSHALVAWRGRADAQDPELALRVARTWSVLAALALGAGFAFNPLVGAAGYAAVGLVALVGRRGFLLVALGVSALPGLVEVLGAGHQRAEMSVGFAFQGARVAAMLWPLAPLLVGAALVPLARKHAVRASFCAVCAVGALLSMAIAATAVLPEANEYKFVRTAALFLAPLAALGWWALLQRGPRARAGALGLLGAWAGLALAAAVPGVTAYAHVAELDAPLDESDGRLLPAGDSDLAAALAWLRARPPASARPLLIASPPANGDTGPVFQGQSFDGPANLQGFSLAALSGATLLADRTSYIVSADPAWPAQLNLVRALYAGVPEAVPALRQMLDQPGLAGRPHFLLSVDGDLPAATLERLAWEPVFTQGQVRLFAGPAPR